jgi:hypothetical protein
MINIILPVAGYLAYPVIFLYYIAVLQTAESLGLYPVLGRRPKLLHQQTFGLFFYHCGKKGFLREINGSQEEVHFSEWA